MVDSRAALLTRSDLLEGLPAEVVRDFLGRVKLERFAPGRIIFRQGEPAERLTLVTAGRVKLGRRGEQGRDNILVVAGRGELLGGLALFDPTSHRMTATALSMTEAAVLEAAAMREWIERHPEAAVRLIRLLIVRAQLQNDFLSDVFGVDVGTRVARAILRDAYRFGRRTRSGFRVNLALSQDELAMYVRASRESVNQALTTFVRLGLIRRDGQEVLILDEDELVRQAGRSDRLA